MAVGPHNNARKENFMCNELSCYQSDPPVLKVDPESRSLFRKASHHLHSFTLADAELACRTGMKPATHLRTKLGTL